MYENYLVARSKINWTLDSATEFFLQLLQQLRREWEKGIKIRRMALAQHRVSRHAS